MRKGLAVDINKIHSWMTAVLTELLSLLHRSWVALVLTLLRDDFVVFVAFLVKWSPECEDKNVDSFTQLWITKSHLIELCIFLFGYTEFCGPVISFSPRVTVWTSPH